MKTVSFEDLMKDAFFQEKVKEVKSDEDLTGLLQSYRIVFKKEDASAESGPSKAAEQLANLLSGLGIETNAKDMQEAINLAEPEEGELDENALDNVAGGAIGIRGGCRNVCYKLFGRRICIPMCLI